MIGLDGELNLERMTWGNPCAGVRRRVTKGTLKARVAAVGVQFEYWDGMCWAEYDEDSNVFLNDCMKYMKQNTAIYVDSPGYHTTAYDISLGQNMVQYNRSTQAARPIRAVGAMCKDDAPSLAYEDLSDLRDEIICPITQEPMKHPVVAAAVTLTKGEPSSRT